MHWKDFAADYLHFSRKDRIAIIGIVIILLVIFFLPGFYSTGRHTYQKNHDTSWISTMQKLEQKDTAANRNFQQFDENNNKYYQYDRPKNNYYDKPAGELFYFDPNTLSTGDWRRLGLKEKTVQTIQNYLSKGGHFGKPEDLKKIYGLSPEEFERLAPYIRIASTGGPNKYEDFTKAPGTIASPKIYPSKYSIIDINSADTAAFISLPGIGSKLSARIINFRDKLGGFYSIEQVRETFGLPDSTFQKIKQYLKLENANIKKININTATADELKIHPYIRWTLANPIVAYRNQHGAFEKVADIKKIMVVTDEVYEKIAPYLTTQ